MMEMPRKRQAQHPERRDGVQRRPIHGVSGGRLLQHPCQHRAPVHHTSGSPNRNTYVAGAPADHEDLQRIPGACSKNVPPKQAGRSTPGVFIYMVIRASRTHMRQIRDYIAYRATN